MKWKPRQPDNTLAANLESTTPEFAPPTSEASPYRFPRRLAEGVSQPLWSAPSAAVAVAVSFGGIYGLPAVVGILLPGGWHQADFLWPSLTSEQQAFVTDRLMSGMPVNLRPGLFGYCPTGSAGILAGFVFSCHRPPVHHSFYQ